MKCLEKDPRCRYASAEALADDLHRFLGNEPIRARPVSMLEGVYVLPTAPSVGKPGRAGLASPLGSASPLAKERALPGGADERDTLHETHILLLMLKC